MEQANAGRLRIGDGLGGAALLAFLYLLSAWATLLLSDGLYGVAALWCPSGVALGFVLMRRERLAPYLAATAVASLAINVAAGAGWTTSVGFTIANVAEPLIAARLIPAQLIPAMRPRAQTPFTSGRALCRFVGAVAIAALASAVIATPFVSADRGIFYVSWASADLLGMMLLTPLLLVSPAMRQGHRGDRAALARRVEVIALLAAVLVVAVLVFSQSSYPVLFLTLSAVIVAAVRLGTTGAAASVLILALVSSIATSMGHGPVMLMAGGRTEQTFFVQFYLLALFASALPTAAMVATQRRLVADLSDRNRMLNQAEAAAQIGHWHYSLTQETMFWSAQALRIYGQTYPGPSQADAIACYVEKDQAALRALMAHVRNGHDFEFRGRIRRTDGVERDVLTRGTVDRRADRVVLGVFGTIQDVTAQSDQERALESARVAAEEAARAARIAAETDPLTALPNRRHVLFVLDEAVRQAGIEGMPLSVAMLDLDHFKQINDTAGHVAGDRVLRRTADAAATALRGTDLIGRFGGEEFVIVLPHAGLPIAAAIAERVRAGIVDAAGDAATPGVTASLGVACWLPGESATGLLQRADAALYAAKRNGRNRVACADDPCLPAIDAPDADGADQSIAKSVTPA